MTDVADTKHLQKRGEIWHYYRRVPTKLIPILEKTFIKVSLGTTDLKEARKRRNIKDVEFDATMAQAEAQLEASSDTAKKGLAPVSMPMLTDYLRQHVEAKDQQKAADLEVAIAASDQAQRAEMIVDAETELQFLKDLDHPNAQEWISKAVDRILEEKGAVIENKDEEAAFAGRMRRALMELGMRELDRLNDHHDRSFHDPMFDPAIKPKVTFGDLADIYWNELKESYKENAVSDKRADEVESKITFFRETIGEGTPVSEIDDSVIQTLRSMLAQLPRYRNTLDAKLSIAELISLAEKKHLKVIGPVTQKEYLNCLRNILKVAVRKGYLSHNPAEGLQPIKKDKIAADKKRAPLDNDQICSFFTGTFYQSCTPDAAKPYLKKDRAWRFWLPLIMALSGARPNEITQLHLDDIKETKAGTWYLDMLETEDDDGKTFKTASSRRRVPIHEELIKIGFLDFVKARKKQAKKEEKRLFWELTPDKYGNTTKYAARRFRESFLPQEITLTERQTFYSFRHTVRDALRRVDAPPETLLAIAGWSPTGKAVSDDYGDPGNPDLHVKWVNKISYLGLDLSFLYGVGADV